jgi:hypothetical protein
LEKHAVSIGIMKMLLISYSEKLNGKDHLEDLDINRGDLKILLTMGVD